MYDLECLCCGAIFSEYEGAAEADWYWGNWGIDPGAYMCPNCGADERDIIEI